MDYKAVLSDLEEELDGIEAEWKRLEAKRTALVTTIEGLRQLSQIQGQRGEKHSESSSLISPRMFRKAGIVPAAVKVLELIGHPLTNRELVNALISGGLPTKAGDPYMTIRSVLARAMKRYSTFSWKDGKWGLPKWLQQGEMWADAGAD